MTRTRFAPSPTGYLHVGSARTALYCWLYAKRHKGTYILRIEDTDRERSTQEAVDIILESMEWLGLTHDEGPFYQTKRFDRYAKVASQLLSKGQAYRCYCSKEKLEKLRESQMAAKQKPKYDGCCRNLKDSEQDESKPHVLRFKNPIDGSVVFDDAVRGTVETKNSELDDLIIVRTDGTPTYNFTVVVDDSDMKVDMVMRGEDHVSNTPRQINILTALGAKIPKYAHIPMILGDDGKRLSKRHGAVSVLQYREEGYLPEALLNYLVRLGWSHGDQEIFSVDEMIEFFDLDHINNSAAAFNTEKLNWLNQHYIKTLPVEEVALELKWQFARLDINTDTGPKLTDVVAAQCDRVQTMLEMAVSSKYFYVDNVELDKHSAEKHIKPEIKEPLQSLYNNFVELEDWSVENIKACIKDVVTKFEIKMGKIAQPVRIAVTGTTMSPSIDLTLCLIGKERTLSRIKGVIDSIN